MKIINFFSTVVLAIYSYHLFGMQELSFSLPRLVLRTIANNTSTSLTIIDQAGNKAVVQTGDQQDVLISYNPQDEKSVRLLFNGRQYSLVCRYSYPYLFVTILVGNIPLRARKVDISKLPLRRRLVIMIDINFLNDDIRNATISLTRHYARIGKEEFE